MGKVDTIEAESDDRVEQFYEILGKCLIKNKEGLARLEKEEVAEKRRNEGDR
jgi:hypothetical protein